MIKIGTFLCATLTIGLAQTAQAGTVVLNFDSVSLSPCCGAGSITDATSYLAGFGVTFTALTPTTLPAIQNSAGSAVIPSSSPNLFTLYGGSGPQAVSYVLNFTTLLSSLSFTRVGVASNVGIVGWTAKALDAGGNVIATVNEGFSIGAAAQIYTLTGSGIKGLEIDARNDLQRTSLNAPAIDDLTLLSATPEPASLFSFGFGMVGLTALSFLRKRAV